MLNFTVGPVQTYDEILEIGGQDVPYFRTKEFSALTIESENLLKEFTNAPIDSKVVFITGSGTASMEATVMNLFTPQDNVLIIQGGSFGERFSKICTIHNIRHTEIQLEPGKNITQRDLEAYNNRGYTALLVNICETSTGVLYDKELLSNFCRENNLLFVVDAISSFLADPLDIERLGIDVMITGSQKALSCAPGVSIIVLNSRAVKIIKNSETRSLYLDLKSALLNAERGQTPFTPAVGILIQINKRLKLIKESGGVKNENQRIKELADHFRKKISELPLDIFSNSLSNAVTPLKTRNCNAQDIFEILKNEYDIWICPNGGEMKSSLFRVGHLGNLTKNDNDQLINALHDLKERGILK